jgi:hypothetical protein
VGVDCRRTLGGVSEGDGERSSKLLSEHTESSESICQLANAGVNLGPRPRMVGPHHHRYQR